MSASQGLTASTVTTTAEFAALENEWDVLVRAMGRPSPYLLHGWLLAWCRHYTADGDLRVQLVRAGGKLVGALPLFSTRRGGLRVAQFLGGKHSALADMLLAPGAGDETPARLVEHALASDHDFADLFGLPGDGPLARAAGAARVRLIERVESPVLELGAGFDSVYNAHTTSKRRGSNKRRLRQLEELGTVQFARARTEPELRDALEEAFSLHHLRWQGRPDGSDFGTDRGMPFQREALAALAKLGVPSIVTLRLDDRPIAFHYSFVLERQLYVHRLAFDPALSRFSPGVLTMLEVLRAAADEGVERVEYLGGDESYKLELSDRIEPLYQGVGMARTLQGRIASSMRLKAIDARIRLRGSDTLRRIYYRGRAPERAAAPAEPRNGATDT
jgi:CelD/BcsL family acetyltransferase involved in cellulose biosynthesis